jgi:L-asparaginase
MHLYLAGFRRVAQHALAAVVIAAIAALPGPFSGASAPLEQAASKPRIAVFSGSNATIQNTPAMLTSNKAREKYGLPLLANPDGSPAVHDTLRPQRLAAPVTVYVEQFSAHPLERDAAELYAPPDGYVNAAGVFSRTRRSPADVAVYEVTLRPEDGLYLLPYMARQANGQAWDGACTTPTAPADQCRQTFFPDASRSFEQIDRFGLGSNSQVNLLSSKAAFDFYRAAPGGGYTKGLPAAQRTDVGEGDIPPETRGQDFFPYGRLGTNPALPTLAHITNVVQRAMASGQYAGGIWLQGSPRIEETIYWLSLLIDTPVPLVANAAQREHGQASSDGDRNVAESVSYILSGVWADPAGRNQMGGVVVQDQVIYAAREVQKGDARPGGYTVAGGYGGLLGSMGDSYNPVLTFIPNRRHTHTSAVNTTQLPATVSGVQRAGEGIATVSVQIKDASGALLPTAIPRVGIVKDGTYVADDYSEDPEREVDILARLAQYLEESPLAGFVAEGQAPYGTLTSNARDAALLRAARSGLPVVTVGRGNAEGFTPARSLFIGGNNLTATKARLLLMASLMRFGSLPPAADPDNPTPAEVAAIRAKLAEYQAVFDTH